MGLSEVVKTLGDGEVVKTEDGKELFKLSSYSGNPILKPQDLNLTWRENGRIKLGAVFNGGCEIYEGKVIIAPRCHKNYKRNSVIICGSEVYYMENYISEVWLLESDNCVKFKRLDVIIRGDGSEHRDFTYGIEDIRIVRSYINEYILVGCGKIKPPFKGENADRIAIYTTKDFKTIKYRGIIKTFDSRNAIPFPEPIDEEFYMLFRFYPNIHIDKLEAGIEQLLNPKDYIDLWKRVYERRQETLLIKAGTKRHEREKVGPGPQLIKTKEGWLMIYHAVGEICEDICKAYNLNGRITRGYSICAALLDKNDPKRILAKTEYPIYIPSHPWELRGDNNYPVDIPNVIFPTGAIVIDDKLLIYCGAGDKYEVLLSCKLSYLIDYLMEYCS